MTRTTRIILTVVVGIIVAVGLFCGFAYFELMGWGGWHPDINSVSAKRARTVDGNLRVGMSSAEVLRIFHSDERSNPRDSDERPGFICTNCGPPRPGEIDLDIFDPRQNWWNSFDTIWSVRTGFDPRGRLTWHHIDMDICCGP